MTRKKKSQKKLGNKVDVPIKKMEVELKKVAKKMEVPPRIIDHNLSQWMR
jgi:hypothetical protein